MKTISALLSLLALGAQAIPAKAARPDDYYRGPAPSYDSELQSYEDKSNVSTLPNYDSNSNDSSLPSYGDKPKGFSDPILPNYEGTTNGSGGNAAPNYEDKSKDSALPNHENKGPNVPGNGANADGAGSGSLPVPDYGNNPIGSDSALIPGNEKKPVSYRKEPATEKKPVSYGKEAVLPVYENKPTTYGTESSYEKQPTSYGTQSIAPSYGQQPNYYDPSVAGPVGGSGRVSGHGSLGDKAGGSHGISIKHGKSKSKVKAHQGLLGSRVKAKSRSKFTL